MRHAFLLVLPFLLGLAGFALFAPHSPLVPALIVGILCYTGGTLGAEWFRRRPSLLSGITVSLTILAGTSILLTGWYYLDGRLHAASMISAFVGSVLTTWLVALFWRIPPPTNAESTESNETRFHPIDLFFLLASCLSAGLVLYTAWRSGTTESIRTPWPLLPAGTIAAGTLAMLAAWGASLRGHRLTIAMTVAGATIAITGIAPLVYQLGYGFDGFLHRASEQVLLSTGTLTPKPPYYLGQYTFVTWIVTLFSLPLRWVDLALVPVMTGIVIGILAALLPRERLSAVPALLALLPFHAFIATTPQSLAYVLGFLALMLASSARDEHTHPAPALAAVGWSLATHPLAGLPFALLTGALLLGPKRILSWIAVFAAALAVPIAFYALSKTSGLAIEWQSGAHVFEGLWTTLRETLTPPATRVALWADAAAFVAWMTPLAIVLLAGYRLFHDRAHRGTTGILISGGTLLMLAGAVFGTIGTFTFLISYERGDYAARLITIGLLLLAIPSSQVFGERVKTVLQGSAAAAVVLVLFLTGWHASRMYLALPRHDATAASHGWSVGRADLEAIRAIDRDAQDAPYTVLANQTVSAAAVELLGFKRYVHDPASGQDIFFYPIPTGGPLYDVFLRATGKDPSRDTIKEAATLGQSDRVFVVLNRYWWDAERVGEALASTTKREFTFGDGAVRVFSYDFSTSTNAAK